MQSKSILNFHVKINKARRKVPETDELCYYLLLNFILFYFISKFGRKSACWWCILPLPQTFERCNGAP